MTRSDPKEEKAQTSRDISGHHAVPGWPQPSFIIGLKRQQHNISQPTLVSVLIDSQLHFCGLLLSPHCVYF